MSPRGAGNTPERTKSTVPPRRGGRAKYAGWRKEYAGWLALLVGRWAVSWGEVAAGATNCDTRIEPAIVDVCTCVPPRVGRGGERRGRRAMATPVERIYGLIGVYLAARAASGEARVTLPFSALEGEILGRPLPRTARHPRGHRQWWRGTGTGFPHAWYGWQRAGWTVEAIDLEAETVTFQRTGTVPTG